MSFRLSLSLAVLLPILAPSLSEPPDAASNQHIPETHAMTLSNSEISLPHDLAGHSTVLILGFSQGSRPAVTQWAQRLAADYRDSPTVLYYEMPILAEVPRLLRGMVVRKIKQDVPPRAQPRFVPITDNAEQWKELTGYDKQHKEDAAYLLLVDPRGTIQSREAAGPPTDQTYAALKQHLESIVQTR